jgi:hypothetical protein
MLKHTKDLYPRDLSNRLIVANLYRRNNMTQADYKIYLPLIM